MLYPEPPTILTLFPIYFPGCAYIFSLLSLSLPFCLYYTHTPYIKAFYPYDVDIFKEYSPLLLNKMFLILSLPHVSL